MPNVHDCTAGSGYGGIFSANVTPGVCGRVWEMVSFKRNAPSCWEFGLVTQPTC